jgi:triosephosphate isomerase (TIM)
MPAATDKIRPLIAGNWKMNGGKAELTEAIRVSETLAEGDAAGQPDVLICPPATLVMVMAEVLKASSVKIGAQDCHAAISGAHTGDVSAELMADAGASAVIVGHSERRADHGELCSAVRAKAMAAWRAGLIAIVCIGEAEGQRVAGLTLDVITRQLANSLPDGATAANTVVAYEPVWAIGTGLTPTLAEVGEVHAAIRAQLTARFGAEGQQMRVLYGGSVKPSNAKDLLSVANVNGALVGGASLKSQDFLGIIAAAPAS